MQDESFVYFTQDNIIEKIDIDPRLVDSFKRVMTKLQEYFNANGYTSQRNYREYLENFLLNSGENNMRFYINKIEPENVDGFYQKRENKICINENRLNNPSLLDSTICHEFIHFLVTHGLEKGKADSEIMTGGFIDEALTEMLTQQMYPYSNSYDAQVTMQKYANLLSGKSNDFSLFLRGHIDANNILNSSVWKSYLDYARKFQTDFEQKGYITLQEAQSNQNFIDAQRSLIEFFLRPTSKKNIDEYILTIEMLLNRPVNDSEWINQKIVPELDKSLISSLGINDEAIIGFLNQKLVELRETIKENEQYKGQRVCEIEIGGSKFIIDDNYELSPFAAGMARAWNPHTKIMTIAYNGEQKSFNMNELNFDERQEKISKQMESIKTLFKPELKNDLTMIGQAIHQNGNLSKLEKFTVPIFDDSGKYKTRSIYIATHGDRIILLNDSTMIKDINNVELDRYIGLTSTNPNIAATVYERIGTIDNGKVFCLLNAKQLKIRAIKEYRNALATQLSQEEISRIVEQYKSSPNAITETEEDIQFHALLEYAKNKYDTLIDEEKQKYITIVQKNNPTFVISTKDGKVDISMLFGSQHISAFQGRREVLLDVKGLGKFNDIVDEIAKRETKITDEIKTSLDIDAQGNLQYKGDEKMSEKAIEDYYKEYSDRIVQLRGEYGKVATQIESLMKQNTQSPIQNYQQQLDSLIRQRDLISSKIESTSESAKTYENLINIKKAEEQSNIIGRVEKLLRTRITDTAMYEYDSQLKASRVILKDAVTLQKEHYALKEKLDQLYYDNKIDKKTYHSMKMAVYNIYESMVKKVPKPSNPTYSGNPTNSDKSEFTQQEELTPFSSKKEDVPVYHPEKKDSDDLEFKREQMRKKYRYDDMSDREKEKFDEELEATLREEKGQTKKIDSKEELEEQRRNLRRKQFEERMQRMGIDRSRFDLNELFRQQEQAKKQRLEQEEIENTESFGMHM